jgi:flavodoxin I
MKLGLVFGSTTGNTEDAADAIQLQLAAYIDEALNIDSIDLERLVDFDVLIVGVPTWDVGELQDSWHHHSRRIQKLSFEGVRVAFFGQGDQCGYPYNFQDAMGILRDMMVARGAQADIGHFPAEGYEFEDSRGLVPGSSPKKFVGLALDEHNQSELTKERIRLWCQQLEAELGL